MLRYILRRVVYSILVLWGVVTLVFFLFNVLPGDPARLSLGQRTDPASIEATRKALHLDRPLLTRYGLYLNDLSPVGITSAGRKVGTASSLHLIRMGDSSFLALKTPFPGWSYRTKRPVGEVLAEGLPGTIVLASSAMLIAVVLGMGLGILAALKKDTAFDTGSIAASVAGISMPSFFAGLVIAYVFGHLLGDFTGLGMTGSLYKYDAVGGRHMVLKNLILPAIALSIRPMTVIIQLTRSALLDVLSQDFIRTAYARGLKRSRVVLRHALPNALNPVLTAIPAWLAELLAGSFFVEYIFGWKGIGKITVDALEKFDVPLIMGAVLLTALIFIIVRLLAEMLYGLLDPRVMRR